MRILRMAIQGFDPKKGRIITREWINIPEVDQVFNKDTVWEIFQTLKLKLEKEHKES